MTLPGTQLLALARLVLEPGTVARVLEPLVADWQREWLTTPTLSARTLVRVRGLAAFTTSAGWCLLHEPVARSLRIRAWALLGAFAVGGTALQLSTAGGIARTWYQLALLLPGYLALGLAFAALPVAMTLGAARRQHATAAARQLVRATIALMAMVFVLHNWGMPLGTLELRKDYHARAIAEALATGGVPELARQRIPRDPGKSQRDLTLPELWTASPSSPGISATAALLREERHLRATMPLMPLALAIFGWTLTRGRSTAPVGRLVFWWLFAATTYFVAFALRLTVDPSWGLPRELAVWLPLVLWLMAAAVLHRSHRPHETHLKITA